MPRCLPADKSLDQARIQLQDGGRKEIVGDDNRRLMHRQRLFAAALQMAQSAVQQIVDINIARLQIGIVPAGDTAG
jgi:hypothetical protein